MLIVTARMLFIVLVILDGVASTFTYSALKRFCQLDSPPNEKEQATCDWWHSFKILTHKRNQLFSGL
jgi:hypothetical protein